MREHNRRKGRETPPPMCPIVDTGASTTFLAPDEEMRNERRRNDTAFTAEGRGLDITSKGLWGPLPGCYRKAT